MQHLSRRFSGNAFLYVVIASPLAALPFILSFTSPTFFSAPAVVFAAVLAALAIYLPPLIAAAKSECPRRQTFRLRAFTFRQLLFTLGVAICVYFAADRLGSLIRALQRALLSPPSSVVPGYFGLFASSAGVTSAPSLPSLIATLPLFALEALLFLGAVLSGLQPMRPLKACLTIALLFALVRFNLPSFIPNALVGFVLAFVTLRTQSIFPGMIAGAAYLTMSEFGIAGQLAATVFSPAGIGENTAAVVLAIAFTLLGGLLLVKMPTGRYEKGGVKRALGKLRRAMPGLFTLDALSLEETEQAPQALPADKNDRAPLEDATGEAPATAEEYTSAQPPPPEEAPPDPRENNPLIAGVFVSAIATVVLFGLSVFAAFGYFGG